MCSTASRPSIGASIGIARSDDSAGHRAAVPQCRSRALPGQGGGAQQFPAVRAGDGRGGAGAPPARGATCVRRRDRGEFELHYQPMFDLASGSDRAASRRCCAGIIPMRGRRLAGRFHAGGRRIGLIMPAIDAWVLRDRLHRGDTLARRHRRSRSICRPPKFKRRDIARRGAARARRDRPAGAAAGTRNQRTHPAAGSETAASRLCAHCTISASRIALDDFGTGYSSLSYLRAFRVRQDQDRPLVRRARWKTATIAPRSSRRSRARPQPRRANDRRRRRDAGAGRAGRARPAAPRRRAICTAGRYPPPRSGRCSRSRRAIEQAVA